MALTEETVRLALKAAHPVAGSALPTLVGSPTDAFDGVSVITDTNIEVNYRYQLATNPTENLSAKYADRHLRVASETVFAASRKLLENPRTQRVQVNLWSPDVDNYGNPQDTPVLSVVLTRKTAAPFNWSGLEMKVESSPASFLCLVSYYSLWRTVFAGLSDRGCLTSEHGTRPGL